jgi:ZIP family zinc transporter
VRAGQGGHAGEALEAAQAGIQPGVIGGGDAQKEAEIDLSGLKNLRMDGKLAGGALTAAVALVLVPEGIKPLPPPAVAACFAGGGLVFMALDRALAASGTESSQLTAMVADFVPEALALGATFAANPATAVLLAALMTLQNLPEGFNAYRELSAGKSERRRRLLRGFAALALLGPGCGLAGHLLLGESPEILAAIMLFAAGGILYLVFQDLAPQARLERHWAPPLGAVAGFLLGLIGHVLMT